MAVSLEYCSVSCNANPHALSWEPSGDRLAFATDKSVALAETVKGEEILYVKCTLHGHNGRVNCVKWITSRGGHVLISYPNELVSGSIDKTLRIWRETNGKFECVDVLKSHTESVTCVTGAQTNEGVWLFSAGSDSNVIAWLRSGNEDKFIVRDTISFGRGFVFTLDCYHLPGNNNSLFLVCGGDDGNVNCFAQQNEKFIKVLTLSGHVDWIRDVCVTEDVSNGSSHLLIASSSQDTYIRLWRLKQDNDEEEDKASSKKLTLKGNSFKLRTRSTDTLASSNTDDSTAENISSSDANISYSVRLESVLCGHDDWVYSCRWSPPPSQPLTLLSASMDKTMILWRPHHENGLWFEEVRLGDVGGNTLGLYGGIFGKGSDTVLGHGYQGSLHHWKRVDSMEGGDTELWRPLSSPSGHFGPVEDCRWEPEGRYLLSVSSDQSTRLHAPWRRGGDNKITWHELARPQIHGYDITCLAPVTPLLFATGADEKVLRVFSAPQHFIVNFSHISGIGINERVTGAVPLGASIPALGLSNKAVFTVSDSSVDEDNGAESSSVKNSFSSEVPVFSPIELTGPPTEEHLLQNTLWPEAQKLYGHSYELYSVASNGRYIASACKASQVEYASIRIWDTLSWTQVAVLTKHSLTVTQLSFSHCGTKLVAVSRDRLWSLWTFHSPAGDGGKEDGRLSVDCVAVMDKSIKAHSRIIWSCSWSHDDICFATSSRDKKVCVWSASQTVVESAVDCGGGWKLAAKPFELSQSVTAIDFAPFSYQEGRYVLAAGLENGHLSLLSFSIKEGVWSELVKLHPFMCHTSTVSCIQWQPGGSSDDCLLATCSSDHSVRIIHVKL